MDQSYNSKSSQHELLLSQRQKALDKQLHSLIEQLAAKQAQAEGLVHEVHLKKMELVKANRLLGQTERSGADISRAKNRFERSGSDKGPISYDVDTYHSLPIHLAGRSDSLQRLMLLRSAFVLHILVLHRLVFIKISF
ncbi:uncharacterized protein [Primulina eburnea]|uniref:uncharacterized protein n=1 Tax=Primulina eburnea TaxID=1245227 RepID=UPI003C6BFB43